MQYAEGLLLLPQVRLAAKVYNCTPEQLPLETHQTLASLLSCGMNGMTGSIRPGCVTCATVCCMSPLSICLPCYPKLVYLATAASSSNRHPLVDREL
jgi:hypothetical protein